jgi:hypothetical protein
MAKKPQGLPVQPERLFSDLDGHDLKIAGRRWHVEVYGVCDQGDHRWLQLSLRGRGRHMITVTLHRGDGARKAVPLLSAWLANPARVTEILSAV